MQKNHSRNVCGLKYKVAKFRNFMYVCIIRYLSIGIFQNNIFRKCCGFYKKFGC